MKHTNGGKTVVGQRYGLSMEARFDKCGRFCPWHAGIVVVRSIVLHDHACKENSPRRVRQLVVISLVFYQTW